MALARLFGHPRHPAAPPAAGARAHASAPLRLVLRWLAALAVAALIWVLTTHPTSAPLGLPAGQWDKVAHALAFGALTALLAWAAHGRVRLGWAMAVAAYVTLVFGAVVELYQAGSGRRSCELSDWLADLAGALSALGAYALVLRAQRGARRKDLS